MEGLWLDRRERLASAFKAEGPGDASLSQELGEGAEDMFNTQNAVDDGRSRKDLKSLMDDYERKLILLALDAAGGHQRRAAASLGLLPSTLSQKMKRLGVRRTVKVAWSSEERELLADALIEQRSAD
jgi:DNA-binding NtrC family response regulator